MPRSRALAFLASAAIALVACNGDDVGTVSATATTSTSTSTSSGPSSSTDASSSSADGSTGSGSQGSTGGTAATSGSGETTGAPTSSTSEGLTSTGGPSCGDGVVDPGEECDGGDLGGATCTSLDFDGGDLTCLDTCVLDTSACTACGDGDLDEGEACDDGNTDAGDGCDASCQIEACDPDGVYAVQGAPIAYSCCNGLVSVNVNAFTLLNNGASITSSPSNPVPMSGAPTTCPEGEFANQGSIPGGCTESYAITGAFDDKDTWSGTYEVKFQGADCTCFNGQLGTPCVNQSFPVTAKR